MVYHLLISLLFSSLLYAQEPPAYCQESEEKDLQECHTCRHRGSVNSVTRLKDSISAVLASPENLQKELTQHALSNLIEQKYHLAARYPELASDLVKPNGHCSSLIKKYPKLNIIKQKFEADISTISHSRSYTLRKQFEKRTTDDFKKIEFIWERVARIHIDQQKLISRLILLSQRRSLIKKSLLVIGDKHAIVESIDKEIEQYSYLKKQNENKLNMSVSVVGQNPLLVSASFLATTDSVNGLKASKLFNDLKENKPDFNEAALSQLKSLDQGMEKICKAKGKHLHHRTTLVNDYFFTRFNSTDSLGVDSPESEQVLLQSAHCKLIKKHPVPHDKHKLYSLATAGILLTGLALTPFTGGGSIAAALLWTAGVGGSVLGGIETHDAWNEYVKSKALSDTKVISSEDLAKSYELFRNNAALSALDAGFLSLDAYRILKVAKASKVARSPTTLQPANQRQFVRNFADFKTHTKLHIKRVENIGIYMYKKHPEHFTHIDDDLARRFLQKHDQGKVNYKLWYQERKKPIIKKIYKFYNVPKEAISKAEFKKLKESVDSLNDMDTRVAHKFFKDNNLIKPNGELSESANELLELEHLADLVDRGKNIVSPEEFAKKAMIPASNWFKKPHEVTIAMDAEKHYTAIIKGLDFPAHSAPSLH